MSVWLQRPVGRRESIVARATVHDFVAQHLVERLQRKECGDV
jgi:hypothetical protein